MIAIAQYCRITFILGIRTSINRIAIISGKEAIFLKSHKRRTKQEYVINEQIKNNIVGLAVIFCK